MKKLIAVLLVVATCMLALAGCGGSGSAAKAEQNVTLKLGFQANSSSNEYKAAELMAEKAKEYSNGTITIEIYPGAQLSHDRPGRRRCAGHGLRRDRQNGSVGA